MRQSILAAFLLSVLCVPAWAETMLSGHLEAGGRMRHPLSIKPGEVVRGSFSGRGLRLALIGADGGRLRLLARGERDGEDFAFVAGDTPPQALEIAAARDAADYALTLSPPLPWRPAPPLVARDVESVASPALRAVLRGADLAAFWRDRQAQGGPLVEPGERDGEMLLTFLWRGAAHNAWVFSAPSGDHEPMRRLGDSDLWFASFTVPADTRMTYKLAPDVPIPDLPPAERRRLILATAQRDPLNTRHFPDQVADIFDGESVVELPGAVPQPWVGRKPGTPLGAIERSRLDSVILGNQRDMVLYRPPGWVPGADGNALLVLFDAEFFHDRADIAAVLDTLHHAGAIAPTAALMVANPSNETRSAELPPNPAFARFLIEEALPWAASRGVAAPGARTVAAGASYGGLAAAYVGLEHPRVFGNVVALSPSFWWAPPGEVGQWLVRRAASLPAADLRFFIEPGSFEGGARSILQSSRAMRDALRAKGLTVHYRETPGGHDLMRWRASLGDALAALLPPAKASSPRR